MKKNGTKQDVNLVNLIERYNNEDKCRSYLEELRWSNGVTCTRCGSKSISRILKPRVFDCNSCRSQFSVTSGNILTPTWTNSNGGLITAITRTCLEIHS